MTGRELIIYILEHGLENKELFDGGIILTDEQKATELNTGVESVRVLYRLGTVPGFKIGNSIFFLSGM